MAKRDFYEVLGISRTATEAEIKKAYRRMAMKYHPDRNPDDAEAESKFKEAKEAYEILSDSQKRAAYDQFGHDGVDQSMGGGFGRGAALVVSAIFSAMFSTISLVAVVAVNRLSVVLISVIAWNCLWKKRLPVPQRKFVFRSMSNVKPVMAAVPRKALSR